MFPVVQLFERNSGMNTGDQPGVMIDIDRRRTSITEKQIADVPRPTREPHTAVVGEVGHRIKRLCALRKVVDDECNALAAKGADAALDWQMKKAFYAIIDQTIELEVWRHFRELAGKPFTIYDDWRVGPERFETSTGDLFRPVGLGEIAKAHLVN